MKENKRKYLSYLLKDKLKTLDDEYHYNNSSLFGNVESFLHMQNIKTKIKPAKVY